MFYDIFIEYLKQFKKQGVSYVEISCKPTPLGVGQLQSNCPEISGSETPNKPHTLVSGKAQEVSDFNKPLVHMRYEYLA